MKELLQAGLARYGQIQLVGTEVVGCEPDRRALSGKQLRRGRGCVKLDQRGEDPVATHDLDRP